jgi:hypothetical protein
MASYKCFPMSGLGMRDIEGSETFVCLKIAKASRCRSGDEGAVNWKTEHGHQFLFS